MTDWSEQTRREAEFAQTQDKPCVFYHWVSGPAFPIKNRSVPGVWISGIVLYRFEDESAFSKRVRVTFRSGMRTREHEFVVYDHNMSGSLHDLDLTEYLSYGASLFKQRAHSRGYGGQRGDGANDAGNEVPALRGE